MHDRSITRLFAGPLCWAVCAFATLPLNPPLHAQQQEIPHPASFDPSDVYFQGWLAARAGERLEEESDFLGAWEKYQEADKMFSAVSQYYPEWRPAMVEGRTERTRESMNGVRAKAEEQQQENQRAIAELEGGQRAGGEWIEPRLETQGILEVDPVATRNLKEAEAEVARLRGILQNTGANSNDASRNASRVHDLQRQRNDLQAQLRSAETNVAALRARLATSPVQNQMGRLNHRIEELEQERTAMGLALSQSRRSHTEAMAKIATLETDVEVMRQETAKLRQRESDLERDLTSERKVANDVIAGMRRQMQSLTERLTEKDRELTHANRTIASLTRELQESRASFSEIREERDTLLRERDQLAALLQLNEGSRISELIDQNMGLARQLREANERVDRLNHDNNATKDAFTEALRDLAIAKAQINRLQQEQRGQEQRLADLRQQLRNEETTLAQNPGADPGEAEMLREIIRRQLRTQEHRRQAREVLLDTARDLGRQDERLAQAVEILDGNELELTPEEQKLIADRHVDGEFISPFARGREVVGRAMDGLNLELDSYDRAATRAFAAGRYLPTRELFLQMVELNPGHTPALCKLGVVHLKLDDPEAAADAFQRAVELDDRNAYAHRMHAFALMTSGDISAAHHSATRSVELAPQEPLAQILLATIKSRLGDASEAETHFKAAINADPMLSEPYFNLAILHARAERLDDAREYYNLALERGAVPDPSLEQTLFQ